MKYFVEYILVVLNASKPNKKAMIPRLLIFVIVIGVISCKQPRNQQQKNTDFKISDLTLKEIPKTIAIEGDLLLAKSWIDKNGENILVVSRTGPFKENESEDELSEDRRYAELFGKQYIMQGGDYKLLWDIYDFERHCPFDLWIGLLPNSTKITDLDNDGITETTLIYKLTCRSDVSPSRMKLLMLENDTKMGLRGLMTLKQESDIIDSEFEPDLSKVDTTGLPEFDRYLELYGRYKNAQDFSNKPEEFLKYAKDLWIEFIDQDEFLQL